MALAGGMRVLLGTSSRSLRTMILIWIKVGPTVFAVVADEVVWTFLSSIISLVW